MAEIMDDVVHLSQEIGPHPTGTEEEQQAALYLAEEIQRESGFTTIIEDFQCVTNYLVPSLVCFGLALVAVIVSIIVPVVTIPCFIAVLIAAVLFGLEVFQKPVLSRFLRTGASQNVVAKYQPTPVGGVSRRRKVILVANYDSGKVLKEEMLPIANILPILEKASAIALALAVILLFFRMTVFATDTGAISSIITMLLVICAILFAIPLVRSIMHLTAPYSQSANNNAAGVSVLLDVARQVGNGLVSNEEAMERAQEEGTTVHGESVARSAGVVPEGASLEYDTNLSPQESLAAAKAAIAALTGKPVADKVPVTDISSRLVKGGGLDPVDEEAVSSVHFEVSETPQVHTERAGRFRTMVSMEDENRGEGQAEPDSPRIRVEKQIHEAEQQHMEQVHAEALAERQQEAAVSQMPGTQNTPASFERPAPMTMVNNASASFGGSVDKTPAWAKKAQEKARKNKPEESQPHKVARSRYADTVAAHLMEDQVNRQREYEIHRAQQEAQNNETGSDNPELASRLAALRSEIESTQAPHITESTQAVLDSMQEEGTSSATHEGQSGQVTAAAGASNTSMKDVSYEVQEASQAKVQTPERNTEDNIQASERNTNINEQAQAPYAQNESELKPDQAPNDSYIQPSEISSRQTVSAPQQADNLQNATQQHQQQFEAEQPKEAVESENLDSIETTHATAEMQQVNQEETIDSQQQVTHRSARKPSSRSISGHGLSQSIRKAADSSHAFASRLKSIASRKTNTTQEAMWDEEQDASNEQYSVEELNTINDQQGATQTSGEQTEVYASENAGEAAAVETADELSVGNEQSSASAITSPGETAAISPIDVSKFMNKETVEDADLIDDEAFDEASFYNSDASYTPQEYPGQLQTQPIEETPQDVSQVAAAKTQRVSSEEIQEAIQEANAHEPVIEPRNSKEEDVQAASPIIGMESMIPQIPANIEQSSAKSEKRQVIVLPDVMAPHATSGGGTKQRAPMAETNESTKAGSKALLSNMLPKIGDTGSIDTAEANKKDTFGLDLPSLGDINSNSAVSATGSFSTVGATGSFAPVGDELVADIDPEDRYVEDADDSAYDEDYTETGAYAGRGYVEMPKSRVGRLFGKFGKKKKNKQQETSVNEWVNVDDSYDARSVGKARGDWSSFRQDNESEDVTTTISPTNNDGFIDVDYHETDFNRRGWNGGAFSLNRLKKNQTMSSDPAQPEEAMEDGYEGYDEGVAGGNLVEVNPSVRIDGDAGTAAQINRELRKLQDFRHPDIDTEVWFVALGSEQYSHSGINAFLDEHADEMKGAVIINLEALGAGMLSVVEQESSLLKNYRPSSRIKRFVRQASERSGVSYHTGAITRRQTPATIAMSRGIQAFTVAGMADGNTALYSAENDIVENIDPEAMSQASKFVMTILKCI